MGAQSYFIICTFIKHKNNAICVVSLVRGLCRKKTLSHLKNTQKGCHGNQSVSCDQALDKLSEKFNGRLFVQEEHGFVMMASGSAGVAYVSSINHMT